MAKIKIKEQLLARREEIARQLAARYELEEELREVDQLLATYDRPDCPSSCPGCDNCRRGERYR